MAAIVLIWESKLVNEANVIATTQLHHIINIHYISVNYAETMGMQIGRIQNITVHMYNNNYMWL